MSKDAHYKDITLSLLHSILQNIHHRDFVIRLWDGTALEAEPGTLPRFTIILNHPGAARKMFLPPNDISLGEAYMFGYFDIEGDLDAAMDLGRNLLKNQPGLLSQLRNAWRLLRLPKSDGLSGGLSRPKLAGSEHSQDRDKEAVTYHYNLSNDFYKLWLDKRMVYSCAYFADPDEDIDTAQERKLDYICRKLRLKPGEHLLDIGCGWGGLILYAAQHYGVEATGITLSELQAEEANARIAEYELQDRCRARVCDYRAVDDWGSYDKLVSVGMFEHVGSKMLQVYFKRAWDLLKPGGVFLNHGIALDTNPIVPPTGSRNRDFINKYIFPDGELVTLSNAIKAAERVNFEVRDVESLREHYALTLAHWLRRFDAHKDEVLEIVDEVTYRLWRIYLAVARYGFLSRGHNLYQIVMAKPDERHKAHLPLQRADWYSS